VTSALEKTSSICQWSVEASGFEAKLLHTIDGNFRAQDCAISPDGHRLVVVDSEKQLHVFNFHTFEKEYSQVFDARLTCVSITKDSKSMLINLASGLIQLLEVETGDVIRTFDGQAQGTYIIRSCFGGAAENFVLSGSEGEPTKMFFDQPA
jgi:WD repeat-containing protein 26